MRILLIGNYELGDAKSMPRFGEMLRRELSARGHTVELLRARAILGRLASGSLGKWLGYIDMYLIFPVHVWLRSGRSWDAIHICDHSNSVYQRWVRRRRPSITCHDLLAIRAAEGQFPLQRISRSGRLQQRWIKRNLLAIPRCVCVSNATARDLQAIGYRGEIRVISNPLHKPHSHRFSPAELHSIYSSLGLQPGECYILHVGGNLWYKNRPGLMRIFAALRKCGDEFSNLKFLLAGHPFNPELRAEVDRLNLSAHVIEVPDPTDHVVQALYSGASLLLFGSLYEGFGWPILEAQTLGCPVATSNREPMIEVAGDAAILIDPEDPTSAAVRIAEQWTQLGKLRESGLLNAARFESAERIGDYETFLRNGATAE